MIMPTCADKFVYEGLSGETYPDRKAGGQKGIYEITGMPVTPYLVPQDCGMHMDTKWVSIYRTKELSNVKKEQKTGVLTFKLDGLSFPACLIRRRNWKMPFIWKNCLPPEERYSVFTAP